MERGKIPNKNMTLVYQNIEPNLELKLFVSGQLTFLLEKCPNNCNLTAKIVDLDDRYLVQLNLASERDLLFATGEDEVIASALDSAITDLTAQMRYWERGQNYGTTVDFEVF
ncbi:hypothetical protein [Bdellovibrio sp. HCB337]|uniref:hypothetical protein n=1 Tax=Bdellovibrio sp. HCB337 TaxID=3394358 RepID=UPI0039A58B6E